MARSKVKRVDPFKTKLQDDLYAGYYLLDDGTVMEIHEALNGEYWYEDSVGSVYYAIYD